MAPKKHIVIVGGGGAGSVLARSLSGQLDSTKYDITLISAHPTFIFYVATLRMLVTDQGALENKVLIPYDKIFINGNGTFKQGVVKAIETEKGAKMGGKIILQDGQSVIYDLLVLSPGSKWESLLDFPFEEEKVKTHIQEWRDRFRNAKKIAIAGGGAVGIELAGELRYYYPDTEVTLVHGDKKLLNKAYPNKVRDKMELNIQSRGVKVILNDYIDSLSASTTRNGTKLDADLVVSARGPRPNTSWIISSLGDDVATETGHIHVRPTLQLDKYPSIFALGDIINYPEQKQIAKCSAHAAVVAANITSLLKGAQPTKKYNGSTEMILVTTGMNGGVGYIDALWGLIFGNWFTSMMKSKGLLIGMRRKALGYSA